MSFLNGNIRFAVPCEIRLNDSQMLPFGLKAIKKTETIRLNFTQNVYFRS